MLGKLPNAWQIYCLFLSCGCGFWLGALYDLFCVGRRWSRRRTVPLWDMAFCLLSALLIFLFALPVSGGVLRWYIWLGIAAGFTAFRVTLGRLTARLGRWLEQTARRVGRRLRRVVAPIERLLARLGACCVEKTKKITKNAADFLKKHLQRPHPMVYNQTDSKME